MLTSISFGDIYKTDGGYLTLIIMNFVIAIAMLFTPVIMRSLIGEGVQATAQTIGTTAALAMVAMPARMATVRQVSREVLSNTRAYAGQKLQNIQNKINRPRGS